MTAPTGTRRTRRRTLATRRRKRGTQRTNTVCYDVAEGVRAEDNGQPRRFSDGFARMVLHGRPGGDMSWLTEYIADENSTANRRHREHRRTPGRSSHLRRRRPDRGTESEGRLRWPVPRSRVRADAPSATAATRGVVRRRLAQRCHPIHGRPGTSTSPSWAPTWPSSASTPALRRDPGVLRSGTAGRRRFACSSTLDCAKVRLAPMAGESAHWYRVIQEAA